MMFLTKKNLSSLLIFTLSIYFIFFFSSCRWKKNFYEVDKGKFYRSAQLTPEELKDVISKYSIKTVIALRGYETHEDWYPEENQILKELGIDFVAISMLAQEIPQRSNLIKLLDTYETAIRPILIHCKSGSDRTGEASAIYQMEYMNYPKDKALNESLRVEFLHFRLFTPAKSYFINLYQGKEWAKSEYHPCIHEYKYFKQQRWACPTEEPLFFQSDEKRALDH